MFSLLTKINAISQIALPNAKYNHASPPPMLELYSLGFHDSCGHIVTRDDQQRCEYYDGHAFNCHLLTMPEVLIARKQGAFFPLVFFFRLDPSLFFFSL